VSSEVQFDEGWRSKDVITHKQANPRIQQVRTLVSGLGRTAVFLLDIADLQRSTGLVIIYTLRRIIGAPVIYNHHFEVAECLLF